MLRGLGLRARIASLFMAAVGRLTASFLAATGTRLVTANLDRVGDVCWTLDLYVKWMRLQSKPPQRTIVIGNPGRRARPYNHCLLDYWGQYVRVVTSEQRLRYASLFRSMRYRKSFDFPSSLQIGGLQLGWLEALLTAQAAWEKERRSPLLTLKDDDVRRGGAVLKSWGLPADAWFVCLHVREPGWFNEGNNSPHRHTDADPMTYIPAVRAVTDHGGWVIRMGDRTMTRLPELDQFIDYAHNPGRSDEMDVFLAASCRFFLGSTSGLFGLPSVFGRPVALANFCPPSDRPWGSKDRFIPKLLWSGDEERFLSFREAMHPELRFQGHFEPFEERGLSFVDNDPDEIRLLALEMLCRDADDGYYTGDDRELQQRYNSIASEFLRHGLTSSVGRDFLRTHRHLLDEVGAVDGSSESPLQKPFRREE